MEYEVKYLRLQDIEHSAKLFTAHYAEVAKNKDLMVLSPDWERYAYIEQSGKLLVLGAYVDGELVGYSVNFVDYHLHYSGLKVCSNDLLFVHPDFRQSPLGLRLMKDTKRHARFYGCALMLWHAKEGSALDQLLQRKRLPVQDIIYADKL